MALPDFTTHLIVERWSKRVHCGLLIGENDCAVSLQDAAELVATQYGDEDQTAIAVIRLSSINGVVTAADVSADVAALIVKRNKSYDERGCLYPDVQDFVSASSKQSRGA